MGRVWQDLPCEARWAVGVAVVLSVLVSAYRISSNAFWELSACVMVPVAGCAVVAELVAIPIRWPHYRTRSFVAAIVCILAFPLAFQAGRLTNYVAFRMRREALENVVKRVDRGELAQGDGKFGFDKHRHGLPFVHSVHLHGEGNDRTIEFFYNGHFPVKHDVSSIIVVAFRRTDGAKALRRTTAAWSGFMLSTVIGITALIEETTTAASLAPRVRARARARARLAGARLARSRPLGAAC
jgi:hypothetical protein